MPCFIDGLSGFGELMLVIIFLEFVSELCELFESDVAKFHSLLICDSVLVRYHNSWDYLFVRLFNLPWR